MTGPRWTVIIAACLAACGQAAKGGAGAGAAGTGGATGGSGGTCPAPPTTGDIPGDVAAVLAAKCWSCHQDPPKSHAPFPLTTYQDLVQPNPLQPGHLIVQTMALVILPDGTRPAGLPHMPLSTAPQLTSAELATLSQWLDSCAVPVPEQTDGGLDADDGSDGG